MLSRKFSLVPRVWGAGAACDCGAGAEKQIEGMRRLLVRLQRMKCFETPLIFDGGLGTHLESRGNDISGQLWSAQILRENPAEIQAAHTCKRLVLFNRSEQRGRGTDAKRAGPRILVGQKLIGGAICDNRAIK